MKKEDLELFIKLYEDIDILSSKIFRYAKEKYEDQLEFGRYSSDCDFELDERGLDIEYEKYGHDCPTSAYLPTIPLDYVVDESLWKQFLDKYFEAEIAKQKEAEKRKAEEEYQRYLKLKAKYETL